MPSPCATLSHSVLVREALEMERSILRLCQSRKPISRCYEDVHRRSSHGTSITGDSGRS